MRRAKAAGVPPAPAQPAATSTTPAGATNRALNAQIVDWADANGETPDIVQLLHKHHQRRQS